MDINIKEEIVGALQKRVDSTDEFNNLEEYVNYVLSQVADRLENESESGKEEKQREFSEEDEKKVKERLRALGYLD